MSEKKEKLTTVIFKLNETIRSFHEVFKIGHDRDHVDHASKIRREKTTVALMAIYTSLTACLFIMGIYQAYLAHQAMVSSGRAWLAPNITITFDTDKRPTGYTGYLENTGHEPATQVTQSTIETGFQEFFGPFFVNGDKDICKKLLIWGSDVVYPQDKFAINGTVVDKESAPKLTNAPGKVTSNGTPVAGVRIGEGFWIHGCVAYKTFGETHYSEFCYWLGHDNFDEEIKTRPCANMNGAM